MIDFTSSNGILCDPVNMDPSLPTGLWWCLDAEDVFRVKVNAVTKAWNATWDDVGKDAWIIEKFSYILVCAPFGEARDQIVQELTSRFSIPVLIPSDNPFAVARNVRELIDICGTEKATQRLLFETTEIPVQGLLNVADIDCMKRMNENRVLSGFRVLDSEIGGFSPGELSVWTGKRGEGKSTFLGQIALEAINQGHKVCVYSGELPKRQFKLGLLQQAAGHSNVVKREDTRSGRAFYDVKQDAAAKIDRWWDKYLFLTDIQRENAHDETNILKLFEYARRRYGCDVFLVDNIMTAQLKNAASLGYWQAQSAFTGRLVAFAKGRDVHVHLVAHPRKTQGRVEADDVGGSSDITNRADNVFKIERVKDELTAEAGHSMLLTVLKNREFGALPKIEFDFNPASKRFYPAKKVDGRVYSWERADFA